jgi:L-phenylalanine/L-methionine N-acetyltransferase
VGHSGLPQNHGLQQQKIAMQDAHPIVRRAHPGDCADYARIMGDPEVYPGLLQLPMSSEVMWRKRLEEGALATQGDLPLVAELAGHVVGTAGLHMAPQLRRRHCAHIGIGVAPQAQRQGVGSALMQAMCDYADNWAHVLRLELTVFSDNLGAIALYEKFGFRLEGTHRAYALRDGVYADVHAMARLHPNPPVLQPGTP